MNVLKEAPIAVVLRRRKKQKPIFFMTLIHLGVVLRSPKGKTGLCTKKSFARVATDPRGFPVHDTACGSALLLLWRMNMQVRGCALLRVYVLLGIQTLRH